MKKQIKKWVVRFTGLVFVIVSLLLVIVLNPILCYANKTVHNNFTIFSNKIPDTTVFKLLDQATGLLQSTEYYRPNLRFDICLNDGSKYPTLIRLLKGQAFASGFYNKVVVQGTADFHKNFVEINGYKWNLMQLLAHEMTHCLQFDKLGLWRSNPIANIPLWKWEGYAEYVSRQEKDQKDLLTNIKRLHDSSKNSWAIYFADSSIAPREYYEYWNLVQFCIDIKKMTYTQILADTSSEKSVKQQMLNWLDGRQ